MAYVNGLGKATMNKSASHSNPAGLFPAAKLLPQILLAIVGFASLSQAAVAVNSVSNKDTGANTSLTLPIGGDTWTHSVSGNNTLLIVGVAIHQTGSNESVSTVTHNGKSLTFIGSSSRNKAFRTELWYRLAPDEGTYNIVVTLDSAARFVAGAISFAGVSQSIPLGTYAGVGGYSSSLSVNVSSEEGGMVVDVMGHQNSSTTAAIGAGQTQRWMDATTNGTPSNNAAGYSSTEAGAAGVTMSWNLSSKENCALSAVPIIPSIDSFSYRKLITIDRTKVGVTGTSATTLSNYPVLINVTDNDLRTVGNGGYVEDSNGYDIIFRGVNDDVCGGAGTNPCTLDHQIEKYDQITGEFVAWVRLPSLNTNAASSDTAFYMYFGNKSISSSLEAATGVWDSNFQAVWHMSDNAASTTVLQSTSVTTPGNGIAAADTNTKSTTGQIYGALSFNGSSDYIHQSSTSWTMDPQGYTLSAWIQTGTASGHKIIGFEDQRTGTASYSFDRMLWIGTDGKAYAGCYSGGVDTAASTSAVNDSSWHYLAAQINDTGNMLRIYVDGTLNSSTNTGGNCSKYKGYWRIGSYKIARWPSASDGYYAGNIDEVRISSTIRSADWIKTDYNNQSSPSTFYSIGSLEESPITQIELISFTAENYSGVVHLQWQTGYEIDNLGFRIYREGAVGLVRITPSMIAGSALMARGRTALASGRTYVWQDVVDSSAQSSRYWLEDIDTKGKSTWHGPAATVKGGSEPPSQLQSMLLSYLGKGASNTQGDGWEWNAWTNREALMQRPVSAMRIAFESSSPDEAVWSEEYPLAAGAILEADALYAQPDPWRDAWVKILVNREGWYRVTQPELVQAGLSPSANPKNLQLYADGVELPLVVHTCGGMTRSSVGNGSSHRKKSTYRFHRLACEAEFGENDWIEFYGTALDTPWSDTRAYWIVEGNQPGKRIVTVDGSSWMSGLSSLTTTIEYKPKLIYWSGLLNGDGDNFFGPVVNAEGDEESVRLDHLDALASNDGVLQVKLQGVTAIGHDIEVQVNGTVAGRLAFEGQSAGAESFLLPPGLLMPGENIIRLVALNGEEDISLIEYLRISYHRRLETREDSLQVSAPAYCPITVEGFTSPVISVVDVTDPLEPKMVAGNIAPKEDRYAVTAMAEGSGGRTLYVFADTQVQTPAAVKWIRRMDWYGRTRGADVVIISHTDFVRKLPPLKKQYEAEGFTVALADVEEIYDEFSYGNKTPYALKDFLAKALVDWDRKPKYLLLVGDASFDPRNYLGLGDFDFLPTKLIDTTLLETASDDWFADFDEDGVPEIAVGRLPARTQYEASVQVEKIVAYKQAAMGGSPGSWAEKIVLVADRNDGFEFESATDGLSDLVPGSFSVSKIYRGLMGNAAARAQVLQDMNAGALLVNYLGHGAVDLWQNLITGSDASELTNGARLPLVIAMTCLNGYFSDIYTESLAEALMKASNGGAVGVWTSSGLTEPGSQEVMNDELFIQLFHYGRDLGEAVIRAKESVQNPDVRKTWILFGDPTMRLPF